MYYTPVELIGLLLQRIAVPVYIFVYSGCLGLAAYAAVYFGFYSIIRYSLGYEALTASDEFFLLDNPKNRPNIITVMTMEKFESQTIMKTLYEKVPKFQRLRHKIVKRFGQYFFKPLDDKELLQALPKHYICESNISTKQDIEEYTAKLIETKLDLNSLLYKVILVENYGQNQSLLILVLHHSVCDGIATLAVTDSLSEDNYQRNNYPKLQKS